MARIQVMNRIRLARADRADDRQMYEDSQSSAAWLIEIQHQAGSFQDAPNSGIGSTHNWISLSLSFALSTRLVEQRERPRVTTIAQVRQYQLARPEYGR